MCSIRKRSLWKASAASRSICTTLAAHYVGGIGRKEEDIPELADFLVADLCRWGRMKSSRFMNWQNDEKEKKALI